MSQKIVKIEAKVEEILNEAREEMVLEKEKDLAAEIDLQEGAPEVEAQWRMLKVMIYILSNFCRKYDLHC